MKMKRTREETNEKKGGGEKENGGKSGRMQLVTEMRNIGNRINDNMDTM
jgi:hypothetical protein